MKNLFVTLFVIPSIVSAQSVKMDSIWQPLKFFMGSWQGIGEGEPGKGSYERTYQFILERNFINIKNKSVYSPTEKNPQGEVHEDIGYISYDKARKIFVLRQFHIEGFVNQYKLENISDDGKTIVFISEAIENISPGWRAKETYQLINGNEFRESFELAPPNGIFEIYTKATFKRVEY